MTSETLKNAGKIETKQVSLEIEWKIPDFFSLEKDYYKFTSPVFEFLGATWLIGVIPNSTGFLLLYILKRSCGSSDVLANYTIGIKYFDGGIYKSARGINRVKQIDDLGKSHKFLRLTDLQRDKAKIAPQDVLIVFCSLRQEYCGGSMVEVTTQTEISEGHVSAQVAEKCLDQTEDEESNGKEALLELEGIDKLADDVKGLLLNGTHSDVTIKISDREFRTHRAILGARSSVFQSMFSHDTTERNKGVVQIDDCDPDVFQDFLFFLYSGKVEKLSLENVIPLYILADKYDVQEVERECLKFMRHNLCVNSFCDVVALALSHNQDELLKTATDFFAKNTKKVILSTNWQSFLKQYPVESNELYLKAIEYRDQD